MTIKIEEMRIGERYMLDGQLVECVCLSLETHGSKVATAAYRDEHDNFIWRPCADFSRIRPPPKLVRVRIAVAVAENGWWQAEGWQKSAGPEPDKTLAAFAHSAMKNRPSVVHFVEAELPVPESGTFQGVVVHVSEGAG